MKDCAGSFTDSTACGHCVECKTKVQAIRETLEGYGYYIIDTELMNRGNLIKKHTTIICKMAALLDRGAKTTCGQLSIDLGVNRTTMRHWAKRGHQIYDLERQLREKNESRLN